MKKLLLFLAVFLGCVWLGLKIKADPGYVLIAYQHWTAEMPFWFAIVLLILFFILFYSLLRFFGLVTTLPTRWRLWAKERRLRKAHERTQRGLLELTAGQWRNAEKDLTRAIAYIDKPLINYLAAAIAAQELGEFEQRNDYLQKAEQVAPSQELAVGIIKARLQINRLEFEEALTTLRKLQTIAPKNPYILKLLQKCYLELRDYESLEALLPDLRKRKVITPMTCQVLEQKIYSGLLSKAEKENSLEAMQKIWQRIPREYQRQANVLARYVNTLLQFKEDSKAEILLRDAINDQWQEPLVKLYGTLKVDDASYLLSTAEGWLQQHPNDPVLLLTLAKLCLQCELWGKAKNYLETAIDVQPDPESYLLLAKLYEQLNEPQQAENCYKQGLMLLSAI